MLSEQRPLLSAALIVKNEERNLPRCLRSIQSLVDEVIVLDTGSTDRTIEIARELGAKVFEEPWQDDFSLHRNHSIEKASGEWVLTIDADEELVDTNVEETRHRLRSGDLPPVLLVREHLQYPHGRAVTYYNPRILKADSGIRYVYRVHEQLDSGDTRSLLSNVHLLHHGYMDEATQLAKERRNLKLALAMPDNDPHALHCRARSFSALSRYPEAMAAAGSLVSVPVSDTLLIEGCILGAQAAFNCRDDQALDRFLVRGEAVAPNSPDIANIKALQALRNYAKLLTDGDSTKTADFVRPWMFWHSTARVQTAAAILCGLGDDTVVEINRGGRPE